MECNQASLLPNGQMQRCDVTITDEDFRIAADQFEVDCWKKLRGPIATANAKNAFHIGIGKHCMQVADTLFDSAAQVPVAFPDIFAPPHF